MAVEDELKQYKDDIELMLVVLKVQKALKQLYRATVNTDEYIKAQVDGGQFGSVPVQVKQNANAMWTLVKQFKAAVEDDPGIMRLLNWR